MNLLYLLKHNVEVEKKKRIVGHTSSSRWKRRDREGPKLPQSSSWRNSKCVEKCLCPWVGFQIRESVWPLRVPLTARSRGRWTVL